MNLPRHFCRSQLAWMLALLLATLNPLCADMPPLTKGAWTVVVIPDTQNYSKSDQDAPLFTEMTQWMVDNRETRNIQLVLHVGDIVNNNKEHQWVNARNSMKVLDGKIPYVLAAGNHDLGKNNASDRSTMLNKHFRISDNPLNEKMLGGLYREGELQNAWYRFEHEGRKFLIFSLEFGPTKEAVTWANEVASKHAGTPMMLVTHEFIDQKSTLTSADGKPQRTTPQTENNPHNYGIARDGGSVMCGEELWQNLISKHPDFRLVINGHYKSYTKEGTSTFRHLLDLTSEYRCDPNGEGRTTHQMLFNAQWVARGGNGWLRLLEFQPDGKTVQVRTFSPYLARTAKDPAEAFRRNQGCEFTFEMEK